MIITMLFKCPSYLLWQRPCGRGLSSWPLPLTHPTPPTREKNTDQLKYCLDE